MTVNEMRPPDKPYFAYGTNMDVRAMTSRCPHARPIGRGILAGYAFVINSLGVATVVPRPGGTVHGVLWRISPEDELALDEYEEYPTLYSKSSVPVLDQRGRTVEAMVYVAVDQRPGHPSKSYLEAILQAAADWDLPKAYRKELQAWERCHGRH